MELKDYFLKYGDEYRVYLTPIKSFGRMIKYGMLQFTEESAFNWGGPFPGNFVYFELKDFFGITMARRDGIKSVCELGDENMEGSQDWPTTAKPIWLKLMGNDDTSYSKFYATEREALEELKLFEGNEPLDFLEVVKDFEFTFTN